MLDKIIRYISRNKSSGQKSNHSEIVTNKLSTEALALKNAGDQAFKDQNMEQALLYYQQSLEVDSNQPATNNNQGIVFFYLGQSENALVSYDKAIALKPDYAEAYNNRGILLNSLNQHQEALTSFDRAIALKPDYAEAYNNRGILLNSLNQHQEALTSFDRAIALNPDYIDAHNHRGSVLSNLNQLEEALASFIKVSTLKPDYAEAYRNQGAILNALSRYEEALASYKRAITLCPDHAESHYNQGLVLANLNLPIEALASYNNAIAIKPEYADAYLARGNLLNTLHRYEEALASYDQALMLYPDSAETYYNRGVVLGNLKRLDEAVESYDQAIAHYFDNPQFHNNRGVVLNELRRFEDGLASLNTALSLKPDYQEAYYNRGVVLNELRRFDDALESFNEAIKLDPNLAEAYNNKGSVLINQRQLAAALACFEQAILLSPGFAQAYYNRGVVLNDLNRLQEALESFERGLEIAPSYDFLYGYWLDTKMKLCDWSDYKDHIGQLAGMIQNHEKVSPPFLALSQLNSRNLQRCAAEIYAQHKYPASDALPPISKLRRHDRIRVAYFSADFRNHPLSYLVAELFEIHDRSKLELIAFSIGPDTKDEMRSRISAACDQFIDIRDQTDLEVAQLAREMEIDIAIDLGGFTTGCRTGIFAMRAAPLQLSYLGYLGTMGAEYIDYLIADKTIIPPSHQSDYKEKILYLPSYQVNDSKRQISDRVFTREELGLPSTGFIFCCFNNNYKITPNIFDGWCRILKQVEASVLWLLGDSQPVIDHLKAEALARGIDPQRLIFAKRVPFSEYLARYRVADLFLDTSPYNAGTTASDALWAGLPVLTFLGETFAGRMAGSLLHAINMTELVTNSQAEYEAAAIRLASHTDELALIRKKLSANRLTTPLFDTKEFSKSIEAAFAKIYERYQADLPPEHIEIITSKS